MISRGVCIWIVGNATRHTGETKKVHWEESKIDPNEERSEVNLSKKFVISYADDLTHSIIETCEDCENSPHR